MANATADRNIVIRGKGFLMINSSVLKSVASDRLDLIKLFFIFQEGARRDTRDLQTKEEGWINMQDEVPIMATIH